MTSGVQLGAAEILCLLCCVLAMLITAGATRKAAELGARRRLPSVTLWSLTGAGGGSP